jgi:hypothetical protein
VSHHHLKSGALSCRGEGSPFFGSKEKRGILKKLFGTVILISGMFFPRPVPGEVPAKDLRHFTLREIIRSDADREAGFLARPAAMALDGGCLYVVDSGDCDIKVFSGDGRLLRSIGRKGRGPAEFYFPSGVFVNDDMICVADKLNFRIQILDRDGAYLRSFKVPFAPDGVFDLKDDRILVTHNPLNRSGREKMLHAFDRTGRLVWEGLDSHLTGDRVYDSFMNMILVSPDSAGGFYVVYRCREEPVLHFDAQGRCSRRISLDEGYEVKTLALPFRSGRREIRGTCWTGAFDSGRFYLLAPSYTPERDLGPGKEVFLFDEEGRLDGVAGFPDPLTRILVREGRIYAIDEELELRIFEISRR